MSKYVFGENKEAFDIEDALTITKGIWSEGNRNNENRLHRFVTPSNEGYEVEIADSNSIVCGVTISNDSFLGSDKTNPRYCVIQSLGVCIVEDDGTVSNGDRCMPNDEGKATKVTGGLGYRVVDRIDENHVQILMSPHNDMIHRLYKTMVRFIKVVPYKYSLGNVSANGGATINEKALVYEGYVLAGIIGWYIDGTGSSNANITCLRAENGTHVYAYIKNLSNVAHNDWNLTANLLYTKA